MGRYYFHVKRGRLTVLDHVGVELADIDEAKRVAKRRAEEIVLREGLNVVPQGTGAEVIADDWQTVMEVPLRRRRRGANILPNIGRTWAATSSCRLTSDGEQITNRQACGPDRRFSHEAGE